MRKIVALFPMVIMTVASFVLMTRVLVGKIGEGETWRIVASVSGFFLLLIFTIWCLYSFLKKAN